jgi:hypothetical protein
MTDDQARGFTQGVREAIERAVAVESARCAAACREVSRRYYYQGTAGSAAALECADAIERGAVSR